MSEYFTKDVAEILDVSVPTVRNYAKKLEQYNHEFTMRKQARIWTDKEISIIREATDLFKDSEYTLDTCFQYAIAKRNVGEDKAKELLHTPYKPPAADTAPAEYHKEIQAILEGINDIKDGLRPDNQLLEYKEQADTYKNEVDHVKSENEKLNDELKALEEEKQQLEKQIESLKNMNTLEFWKFKRG